MNSKFKFNKNRNKKINNIKYKFKKKFKNTLHSNITLGNNRDSENFISNSDSSVVYVQYQDMKGVMQDLEELKEGNARLTNKVDILTSSLQKVTAQNDVMMQMMIEFCKKSPVDTSFSAVTNINSKEQLDDFEEKLKDDQYKNNTVNLVL